MKTWLLEILYNPYTGAKLREESDNLLLDTNNAAFPVQGDVPLFLDAQDEKISEQDFHYINHYTVDAEVFDYYRDRNDKLEQVSVSLLRRSIIRQIPCNTRFLLDVGCGCAYIAKHFINSGTRVVSLDVAQANVEKALKKYPSDNHAAVVADVFALPFKENTFDCIVASEIIEHTVDPHAFVEALKRVLKPGGTLIISTPYKEKIEYSLCIHCNCKTPKNAHLHSFDKNNMRSLHSTSGLEVERITLVGNKLLLMSRMAILLDKMGYRLWKAIDGIFNVILPKAQHFIIRSKK
jgi:2-polyprenyl-3-methyl-5-hydroxy-6-metoxy-1,4-benzoquinol methylase